MGPKAEQGRLIDLPRGGRRHPRRWPRWVAVGILVAAAGVGALVAVLGVSTVRVEGVERLSPDEVVRRAGIAGGERILLTRLEPIERRVRELPGVRSVDVRRRLPSTLEIVVVEREPLVRLGGTADRVAGPDGLVFEASVETPLPVLVGWDGTGVPGELLAAPAPAVLGAFVDFPQPLREGAERIDLEGEIVLLLDDGTEVRFGPPQELTAKGRAAAAVLEDARSRGTPLAYIDVRTPMTPVSRERSEPAPGSPSPDA